MKPAFQFRVTIQPCASSARTKIARHNWLVRGDRERSGMVWKNNRPGKAAMIFFQYEMTAQPRKSTIVCWAFPALSRRGVSPNFTTPSMHETPAATLHFDPPYPGLVGG